MKLVRTASFVRAARRLVKRDPSVASALRTTLELLAEDPFQPRLRTHKLKGKLAGSWAASVTYELRVVFEFVKRGEDQVVLLASVGTHDEVY